MSGTEYTLKRWTETLKLPVVHRLSPQALQALDTMLTHYSSDPNSLTIYPPPLDVTVLSSYMGLREFEVYQSLYEMAYFSETSTYPQPCSSPWVYIYYYYSVPKQPGAMTLFKSDTQQMNSTVTSSRATALIKLIKENTASSWEDMEAVTMKYAIATNKRPAAMAFSGTSSEEDDTATTGTRKKGTATNTAVGDMTNASTSVSSTTPSSKLDDGETKELTSRRLPEGYQEIDEKELQRMIQAGDASRGFVDGMKKDVQNNQDNAAKDLDEEETSQGVQNNQHNAAKDLDEEASQDSNAQDLDEEASQDNNMGRRLSLEELLQFAEEVARRHAEEVARRRQFRSISP